MAKYFPMFEVGDLLVSMRNMNLVFVLDPDSLAIKWWRSDFVIRQHDPDWSSSGKLLVFNNNTGGGRWSSIVEIDPRTMDYQTLIDGKEYKFFTKEKGKVQQLPSGNVLITSPHQARVFEVNAKGTVVFDFYNVFSLEENRGLQPDSVKQKCTIRL